MNPAELARKLSTEARYDLLRIVTHQPSRRPVHPELTQPRNGMVLVNLIDGEPLATELGKKVARHLAAGHEVQQCGRLLRIVARVHAAKTLDEDIERMFRDQFTPADLDLAVATLAHACAAARAAGKD